MTSQRKSLLESNWNHNSNRNCRSDCLSLWVMDYVSGFTMSKSNKQNKHESTLRLSRSQERSHSLIFCICLLSLLFPPLFIRWQSATRSLCFSLTHFSCNLLWTIRSLWDTPEQKVMKVYKEQLVKSNKVNWPFSCALFWQK